MRDDEFKKLDEFWMKETEALRREPPPPQATRGFAEAVEAKLREKKVAAPKRPWMQWHVPARALVPVFAVLALGVVMALRTLPSSGPVSNPVGLVQAPAAPRFLEIALETGGVDETIALLAELGELESEDAEDAAALEEALGELEVSRARSLSASA